MKPGEIFALFAGIVGLIVDAIGLTGIIFGFVSLPSGSLLSESPFAFAVLSFFATWYLILLAVYFLKVKMRARAYSQGWLPRQEHENEAIKIICRLLCIPLFLLWSVVVWGAGAAAGYPAPAALLFLVVFPPFLIFGGDSTVEIVEAVDGVNEPGP